LEQKREEKQKWQVKRVGKMLIPFTHTDTSAHTIPTLMQQQKRPRGRPKKKMKLRKQQPHERSAAPSPSPSCIAPPEDTDNDEIEEVSMWDPHAGMKPSPMDVDSTDSDVEPENCLPYGASHGIQTSMVEDPRDLDWLPSKERKKLMARKKGVISLASMLRA